jgi:hypothetical protein
MSRYNPLSVEFQGVATLIVIFGTAIAVGMIVDDYISSYLVWGGTDCTTANGVSSCFGYAPGGIFIIILGVAVTLGLAVTVARRTRDLIRSDER